MPPGHKLKPEDIKNAALLGREFFHPCLVLQSKKTGVLWRFEPQDDITALEVSHCVVMFITEAMPKPQGQVPDLDMYLTTHKLWRHFVNARNTNQPNEKTNGDDKPKIVEG